LQFEECHWLFSGQLQASSRLFPLTETFCSAPGLDHASFLNTQSLWFGSITSRLCRSWFKLDLLFLTYPVVLTLCNALNDSASFATCNNHCGVAASLCSCSTRLETRWRLGNSDPVEPRSCITVLASISYALTLFVIAAFLIYLMSAIWPMLEVQIDVFNQVISFSVHW
jgi:hypothetical protein